MFSIIGAMISVMGYVMTLVLSVAIVMMIPFLTIAMILAIPAIIGWAIGKYKSFLEKKGDE